MDTLIAFAILTAGAFLLGMHISQSCDTIRASFTIYSQLTGHHKSKFHGLDSFLGCKARYKKKSQMQLIWNSQDNTNLNVVQWFESQLRFS
jgi:hypothetical protein